MRRTIRRYLPDPSTIRENRWMRPFAGTLLHPRLWHLNRHSAAGAVAVGLFCGLVPGPFQMPSAALACVLLRVNLPLALFATLYTNPFTIVPLYLAAFRIGEWILGTGHAFTPPPEWGDDPFGEWVRQGFDWLLGLGEPLALGLLLLASGLAVLGYLGVKLAWRVHLVRALARRRLRDQTRNRAT
ncbi:MAG: DUF2062 domain-containing protein [Rhodocyclaceae bacterium]|nr:DUF2062 domain-containing protein [Rhodocyclaceae bacterium]